MTVHFAVGAATTRADIPCLCAALADLVRARPAPGEVVCDVSAVACPDVVTVETLARLRLTAGRHGHRFVVRGASSELLALFSLMGLGGFFAAAQHAADGPSAPPPDAARPGPPSDTQSPLSGRPSPAA
ncbi:STAS domain-containing protein [Actinoplanes bogorensis]|uniref:STAS domain-containing protein n=1 Tax=Paractinoplanes bogorensis TaxID=1610840 RepID=A0ABS5Z1U8_9ACTN|nr:STAS domain-containing protein [Actinoplanes bogorensis]MBU2668370.1 STAS domain-containing protein [Actinoplanes bogorensis]